MTAPNLNWIANYIWGIADDVLRDVYVRGKYRDVILPMTVLRRLDAVLESTKQAVLDMKATLDAAGVFEELIRRFNEENNEEAGEHFTPRDAVTLMARLVFQPIADRIESGTYLLYDGACGTGGMLMKRDTRLGSPIAEVHNGSSLFTGSAGQGESNIRRWIIENDWLEAIVALPLNMFYNTGIATYVWVLTSRKPEHRRGKVQLIDATKWFRPLRKNLGKKNCELGPEDIERICRTFLDFEETEESMVFDNEAFGYWKVTVERPLRLKVNLSPERCAGFSEACRDAGEEPLANAVERAAKTLGQGPHFDFNVFSEVLKADMSGRRAKLTAKRNKLLQTALAERDEKAERVVKRVHRRGTAPDRIRGLYESRDGSKNRVVEYEPDTALRDTEQIPLKEEGGIEGFLRREVLPYAGDAWYVAKSVKIGYEISFNRYFHKPEPMRTLDEIGDYILAVERETEGLLLEILGRSV